MTRFVVYAAALELMLGFMAVDVWAGESIWIEGEDYQTTTFNSHVWYIATDLRLDLLSPGVPNTVNGNWHAHYANNLTPKTAQYALSVQEGGDYVFWIRLNRGSTVIPSVYRYRIDNGLWVDMDISDVRDEIDLVEPGIDLRFIAWVKVAVVTLAPGGHTLDIRIMPGYDCTHGGVDAMCLTNEDWTPVGVMKPSDPPHVPGPDVWYPLVVGDDAFSQESIIDMSHLIESPAGGHGFLHADGDRYVFDDGTAIKFWGVDAHMSATVESQMQQARFYAKYGINLVREHPLEDTIGLLLEDSGTGARYFDPEKLDRYDKWFSILKQQGIYVTWSCFFRHVITPADGYPVDLYAELPDRNGGKNTYGLVNMSQALQDSQWLWEQTILNHVNPYTGLAYKDDPALVVIETHNEDCIFWHSPLGDLAGGSMYPLHTAMLKEMWRLWVWDHYGNDTALAAAWGLGMKPGDSVTNSNMIIYAAWEMQADGPSSNKTTERQRMGDFIRFLADMQRGFYERREQRLRDLGYHAVTVSTAWKAGGPAASAANLWADQAQGAIDRHRYFGGCVNSSYLIEAGGVYNDTQLVGPSQGILSAGMFQVEDQPFVLSEWTSKAPNQWKAETIPLYAFYGMGLQGWDGSMHFAGSRARMGNGWPNMSAYVTETPHHIGQFPAVAFSIYHNHYRQGDLASARRLAVDDIFKGVDAFTQILPGIGFDEPYSSNNLKTPLEILAVGRVTAKIGDGQEKSVRCDWNQYWNQSTKTIESNTGELTWDYGRRVVLAHGDYTQGVVGFAGSGSYDLPGVEVDVTTSFVSLLFTPLDNKPLIYSSHILITALARDQQSGAEYSPDGYQLLTTGGPPLMLEPVQAEITFKGQAVQMVRKVDVYGVPTDVKLPVNGNTFTIDGNYATYYYEVIRDDTAVAGRYIVYNGSVFDGNDSAANEHDDLAIAIDKQALLPGQPADFVNYTSYDRGINAIMVDVYEPGGVLSAEDFEFRVGNDGTPGGWTAGPAPSQVAVREGAGVDGSDRVTVVWPDGVIGNCWLQVTIKANETTGLAQPDVFYFGNAMGESGDQAGNAIVDATDEINCRNNPRHFLKPAGITNTLDFNRDGKVDATDEIIARNHSTDFTSALKLITMP